MSGNTIGRDRQPANDDARQARRAAHRQKFDWCRAVSADASLSSAAKHLACIAAIDKAGSNGSFKATQKELAKICGVSGRTVRRAIKELTDEIYWDAENLPGANRYSIFTTEDRLELWLFEESEWEQECRKWDAAKHNWEWQVKRWLEAEQKTWLDAEKQFVQAWLDAEKCAWLTAEVDAKITFEASVFNAMCERGMDSDTAMRVAHNMWEGHREGRLPLDVALQVIADAPQDNFTAAATEVATQGADMATRGTDSGHPGGQNGYPGVPILATRVATTDALTCGDDDSHKYFKSVKDEEVLQEPAPRARDARYADSQEKPHPQPQHAHAGRSTRAPTARTGAAGCGLCDVDGIALSVDGSQQIVLMRDREIEDDIEEYPLPCTHSPEGNVNAILRMAGESRGDDCSDWAPNWTGYPEIDSLFDPHDSGSIV